MRALPSVLVGLLVVVVPVISAHASEALTEAVDGDSFGQLQAGIRDYEYRFDRGPASYRPERGEIWQAPNRAQDLRVYFDDQGVEILERSAEGAPTIMRLALAVWGREPDLDDSPAGALRENDGGMERLRGGLTETYDNSAAGLELGWQVDLRPAGAGPFRRIGDLHGNRHRRPRRHGIDLGEHRYCDVSAGGD